MAKDADKKAGLNARRLAFCREYVIDHIAAQAAIRAGYTEKSSRTTSTRLMANASIREEIARLEAQTNERLEITAERVRAEIAKIAFVDVSGIIDKFDGQKLIFKGLEEIPDNIKPAIKSIKQTSDGIAVELWSKERALDMLAKHVDLYNADNWSSAPRVEVTELSDEELFGKIEKRYRALMSAREQQKNPN